MEKVQKRSNVLVHDSNQSLPNQDLNTTVPRLPNGESPNAKNTMRSFECNNNVRVPIPAIARVNSGNILPCSSHVVSNMLQQVSSCTEVTLVADAIVHRLPNGEVPNAKNTLRSFEGCSIAQAPTSPVATSNVLPDRNDAVPNLLQSVSNLTEQVHAIEANSVAQTEPEDKCR
jgi:hypothetical protein